MLLGFSVLNSKGCSLQDTCCPGDPTGYLLATVGLLESQKFEGTAKESPRKDPDSSEDSDLINTGEVTPLFSCQLCVAAGAEQGF